MSYDWLLFLHVLGAFTMVAGAGLLVATLVAVRRRPDTVVGARLLPATVMIWWIGSVVALVFGIWLALHVSIYSLTDGWILTAIVLWALGGAIGGRIGTGYRALRTGAGVDIGQLTVMHVLLVLVVLAILVDMIYKPGTG